MHRILRSEIDWIAGDAYYGGGMFTGTSFREVDGLIGARSFELGRDVGMYSCSHMKVPTNAVHVHTDSPDLEGEAGYQEVTFRGELLTGVVYDFGGEFCVEEVLFIEGWPHVEIEWYSNGHLQAWEHFRYGKDGAGGRFSWSDMGVFHGCYIIKGPGINLSWRLAPRGGVEWFEVSGDFFHTQKDTVDELPPQHRMRENNEGEVQLSAPSCRRTAEGGGAGPRIGYQESHTTTRGRRPWRLPRPGGAAQRREATIVAASSNI